MLLDIRYVARQLRRSPGFFAAAVLLVAIGIAANTQTFTLVNALLLRSLPVQSPGDLVQLYVTRPRLLSHPWFEYRFSQYLASHSTTLTGICVQVERTLLIEHDSVVERGHPHYVSENYFAELGVRPLHGRLITRQDDHVAVLSHRYWQSAYAGDPNVIGRTLRLRGHAYQIIGVAPREFTGTILDSSPELWAPFANRIESVPGASLERSAAEILGRLRPGVTRVQAEQETAALWARHLKESAPDAIVEGERLEVRSIARGVSPMREQSRAALTLLLAATGLLLLMVCANIGGLLLARATARDRETAVRLAVGASKFQIVRLWLIESLVLAITGSAFGVLLAYATMPYLVKWLPPARGFGDDPAEIRVLTLNLQPDWTSVLFPLVVCAAATLLPVLGPIWRALRIDLQTPLKAALSDAGHHHMQTAICTIQVAFCTVLLVCAGMLSRSVANLRGAGPGFSTDHIAVLSVDPELRRYTKDQAAGLRRRLLMERINWQACALRPSPAARSCAASASSVPLLSLERAHRRSTRASTPSLPSTST